MGNKPEFQGVKNRSFLRGLFFRLWHQRQAHEQDLKLGHIQEQMRQNRRKTNYDIEEIKLVSLNLQVERQSNRRNGVLLLQNSQDNLSEMSQV